MAKAYLILHDGKNILVGEGPAPRKGYHLPGGTINHDEIATATALRELREETGIILSDSDYEIQNANIRSQKIPLKWDVTFIVVKVNDIANLLSAFSPPPSTSKYDEPFEKIKPLASKESWNNENFAPAYGTDWFKYGLEAAKGIICPE